MSSAARRKGRLGYLERRRQRVHQRDLTRQGLAFFALADLIAIGLWILL